MTDGLVRLSWSAVPAENEYVVRRNGRWLASPGNVLEFVDDPGPGTHNYLIRSNQGVTRTDTVCSPTVTIDLPPAPGQRCSIAIGPDGTTALSWTAIDGENSYVVRRNGSWLATTNRLRFDVGVTAAGDQFLIRSSMGGVVTNTTCV